MSGSGAGPGPRTAGRCPWADPRDPLYLRYHDEEWGVPLRDARGLYELLTLEGFQAGLAWIVVLRKRENLRAAFRGFDPEAVARFDDADVARLLADPGIIRSRAKILAAIAGARVALDMREAGEDLSTFLWGFVEDRPLQTHRAVPADVPAATPLSTEIAKALRAKGFKFVGPVIVYAFMQAAGLVNDHLLDCFRYEPIRRMAA